MKSPPPYLHSRRLPLDALGCYWFMPSNLPTWAHGPELGHYRQSHLQLGHLLSGRCQIFSGRALFLAFLLPHWLFSSFFHSCCMLLYPLAYQLCIRFL